MNGAAFDYKFGRKNQWRRTIHNRIVERLTVKPSEAVVLYLAGSADLDRAEFIRRGFKPHNLIAVEFDKDVTKALRSNGKLCLSANLTEVVSSWVKSRVHVVFGDFCCGLIYNTIKFSEHIAQNECFDGCVVAANFLRGRDKMGAEYIKEFSDKYKIEGTASNHRGLAFHAITKVWARTKARETAKTIDRFGETKTIYGDWCRAVAANPDQYWDANPYYTSYRSPEANQTFDSCVFVNRTHFGLLFYGARKCFEMTSSMGARAIGIVNNLLQERGINFRVTDQTGIDVYADIVASRTDDSFREGLNNVLQKMKTDPSNPVARQISAIKAVRTMQQREIL